MFLIVPRVEKLPSRPPDIIPPALPCFCSTRTSKLSRRNGSQAPPGHQGKGRLWYRGPLWDLMEPSFPAPVPLAGTRANFNLVSRPPEPVGLITQVEIQGADLLLGRADVRTERRSGLANSGAGRPTKRPTDQTTDRLTDRRLSNRPTHRPTGGQTDDRPTGPTDPGTE